jgi:hypothetical protein
MIFLSKRLSYMSDQMEDRVFIADEACEEENFRWDASVP